MILKRRVALDGIQLDGVDESILIQGVETAAGRDQISTVNLGRKYGQRVTNRRRDSLDITVRFSIDLKRSRMADRSLVLENVIAWARNGGKLTLNTRPERYAQVILAQAPGEGDMFQWTNEYSLVFRAYAVPYWQELSPDTRVSANASSGQVVVNVHGNTTTSAELKIANVSGMVINTLKITTGTQKFQFTNLNLGVSQTLTIDYDDEGILRMKIGTRSVLGCRTTDSSDEMRVNPGDRTFSFEAQRAVRMTVMCKGRYQ